ncbi:hypothetical protein GCM10027195_43280 [Comamonas sediminis]
MSQVFTTWSVTVMDMAVGGAHFSDKVSAVISPVELFIRNPPGKHTWYSIEYLPGGTEAAAFTAPVDVFSVTPGWDAGVTTAS